MSKNWIDAFNAFLEEVKTNVQGVSEVEPVTFWWGYKMYIFANSIEDGKKIAKLIRTNFKGFEISGWADIEASVEEVFRKKDVITLRFSNKY